MTELEKELLQTIKNLVSKDPFCRSEYGGEECYFCGGDFSNWQGDFKHTKDCDYIKAEKLIKRVKNS